MSKKIEFRILEPCHEDWQRMTRVEQGKFCLSCQKTVVDFTNMSNPDILQHISSASGSVCGRFDHQQLNSPVRIDSPKKMSFRYVWSILLVGSLLSLKSYAQTCFVQGKVRVEPQRRPPKEVMGELEPAIIPLMISGKIVDASDKSPVAFATLTIKPNGVMIEADSNGVFHIEPAFDRAGLSMEISAVGYETKIIPLGVSRSDTTPLIQLKRKPDELASVVVTNRTECGPRIEYRETVSGGTVVVQSATIFEKVKDTFALIFPDRQIQVFPNPVYTGGILHIKFDLPRLGNFELQIINSNGQILRNEVVVVQTRNQVKQVLIPSGYGRGVYFVRLQQPGYKEVYNKRFIVK